uniref:uncharacterized protein LOC100178278 n=1 Tax=Ciona intestinalis TaxID=7719 RepID=UPI000EF44304|nr:uncharacterized protein LOC100178278 [Ciona intestinalis]|eukprot:XP_026689507.1 uncharacterized protein LOC100178278 [Ciona intestinalis]
MKVIMTGMPKTGTKTMCSALRILGYKVYDYREQFWYLGPEFLKAVNEGCTTEEIREMLQDVDAVTDMPACILWEEILRAFPGAKLIHMERATEDEWDKSWKKQLDKIGSRIIVRILLPLTPTGRRLATFFTDAVRACFSLQTRLLDVPRHNTTICKIRYREHNSHVKMAAPKGQIIYFEHSDGWEPLCKFLGVSVPSVPYPHRNKGGEIIDEFVKESFIFKQIKKEFSYIAAIAVALLAITFFCVFI